MPNTNTKPRQTHTGLDLTKQTPLLQFVNNKWIIWLSYDKTKSYGTYLTLEIDGSIHRHTLDPTGSIQSSCEITPPSTIDLV